MDFKSNFTNEENEAQRNSERLRDFPELYNQQWYSQDLNMALWFPVLPLFAVNMSDVTSW